MHSKSRGFLPIALLTMLISVSSVLFWRVGEPLKLEPDALPAGPQLIRVEGDDTAKIRGVPEQAGTFTFKVSV